MRSHDRWAALPPRFISAINQGKRRLIRNKYFIYMARNEVDLIGANAARLRGDVCAAAAWMSYGVMGELNLRAVSMSHDR
jgi:hypothetical protein